MTAALQADEMHFLSDQGRDVLPRPSRRQAAYMANPSMLSIAVVAVVVLIGLAACVLASASMSQQVFHGRHLQSLRADFDKLMLLANEQDVRIKTLRHDVEVLTTQRDEASQKLEHDLDGLRHDPRRIYDVCLHQIPPVSKVPLDPPPVLIPLFVEPVPVPVE